MSNQLGSRFPLADTTVKLRTILLVAGEVGTGKTRFGLTAPGPIVVQSLDKGLEGVVEEFAREKEVYHLDYDWHPGSAGFSQQYARDLREQFITDFEYALDNGARTIMWDKETDVWELFRYAEFGAPNDAPKNYPELNQRYMATINKVKNYDANFFLIEGMGAVWESKVNPQTGKKQPIKTDRREPRGFDRIDEIVFGELFMRREGGEFYIDVGKCRQNSALQDQTFPGMTFVEFGQLLVPDSNAGDWQ